MALLIALGLWLLGGRPGPVLHTRETLVMRLQALQRLEVFQARLLAHESHSEPSLLNTNEFLIVAGATAVYGLELGNAQFEPKGERAVLTVAPVKVLNLMMNPSELEFLGLKKGLFTSQQSFEELKRSAAIDLERELGRQARDPALIQAAESSARQVLKGLLTSLGYPETEIRFDPAIRSRPQSE